MLRKIQSNRTLDCTTAHRATTSTAQDAKSIETDPNADEESALRLPDRDFRIKDPLNAVPHSKQHTPGFAMIPKMMVAEKSPAICHGTVCVETGAEFRRGCRILEQLRYSVLDEKIAKYVLLEFKLADCTHGLLTA